MKQSVEAPQRVFLFVLSFAGFASLVPQGALAQQLVQQYFPVDVPGFAPDFSASVVNRLTTQNQAQGINVGSFVVRPSASQSFGYNSSTLGLPGTGSSSESTSAAIGVKSNWGRDSLGASVSVADQRYLDIPIASFTNWNAALGGAVALGRDSLSLGYSHLALHLSATDLGVFGVTTPAPYNVNVVRLAYNSTFGRFSVTPGFEYQDFSFGTSSGQTDINYHSLSHQLESGSLQTRYQLSTGNAVVAILRGSTAQFTRVPGTSPNNYDDIEAFIGLDFRADALVQYRVLVGGEHRKFSSAGFVSASTPTAEIDAVWTPTRLDTVTASLFRRLDDPESPFARNQTISFGSLQYDHELRQNLYFRLTGTLGATDSQSNVVGQQNNGQTQYKAGASGTWLVNRHMSTSLSYSYNHSHSSSNVSPLENVSAFGTTLNSFTSHTVSISVSLFE
ncbi:outer membrane beta-barrel protein [Lichenicola cladoniae]|uniref:Outer membrane beta-barrel protein n=1 Tax=Lichenicola cladoniae TaxID=1484109 RepID=A0A6M8HRW1_9PROT|nr:outer membrane beta-barrel protein [Lichenicola cladoniae]NPD69109.1 outer membrane beta-barrel protein [Acetobacteraceae bacterium]QKE90931.1 outer membrane beta-barrel protein [Lichenicola cladoniae]